MIKNIFPTPIYTCTLSSQIADKVENIVVPKLNLLSQTTTNKTDYFSPTKVVSLDEISFLFDAINIAVEDYCKQTDIFKGDIINYWIQDYHKEEYHELHAHPGSFTSGVYYIRANENAGDIMFQNPNPHIYFSPYQTNNSRVENDTYQIKPYKGLLILFPHWLFHQVIPSKEIDTVRTCLAFNL